MPLTLTLLTTTTIPLELERLTPEFAREQSLVALEKFPIWHGNQQRPLAEFFRISGDAADSTLTLSGDLSGVHGIGTRMTSGSIYVEGHAGRHLGSQMRGGEIHVSGNVSDWVGGEMRGGLIQVRGSAGDHVGSAYRGSRRGMRNGTILIHGSAGHELGHTMRRGLIAVAGDVGDFVGFNMLAGTILVGGRAGIRHGSGMKRGTIAFIGAHQPPLLPCFRASSCCRPSYFGLLARELARRNFPLATAALTASYQHYSGDLTEGGRGEILLRDRHQPEASAREESFTAQSHDVLARSLAHASG
ncbi:MAG TPA: formylmethanofuran dehydrogenase subunit C [Pirellulaceae bacterium]|nr:formylmethanofuran dehydrogenase subunit C [Pirellulaceae bacterium]